MARTSVQDFTSLYWKNAVRLATITALSANTYANGVNGVGATITANVNGALSIDSVSVVVGDRVLIKNETPSANNGIYVVTATGDGSNPYILTRASDFNSTTVIKAGDTVGVIAGSTLIDTFYIQTTVMVTVGSTNVTWSAFGPITPVSPASGGTGIDASGVTNGQIFIGRTSDHTFSLAAIAGTANQVVVTNGAYSITLSLPQSIDTAATPQWARIGLGQAADSGAVMAAAGQYFSAKVTDTVSGNAWTSNWNSGNVHYIALANATNTATLSNPKDGARYMLILVSGGASSAVTWPSGTNGVNWPSATAPTLSTTSGKVDVITLVYDATNQKYYGGSNLTY
jgi:hypothetical protein